jgi:hypothetical protein
MSDLNRMVTITIPLHDLISFSDALCFDEHMRTYYVYDSDGDFYDITDRTVKAIDEALQQTASAPSGDGSGEEGE